MLRFLYNYIDSYNYTRTVLVCVAIDRAWRHLLEKSIMYTWVHGIGIVYACVIKFTWRQSAVCN